MSPPLGETLGFGVEFDIQLGMATLEGRVNTAVGFSAA